MFRNYLTVAVRAFARHKLYSFINVAGLAVGLAAVILIGLYVRQELSFDKWLANSENIYRISVLVHVPGQPVRDSGSASAPLSPALVAEVPGVLDQTRIHSRGATIRVSDKRYAEWINTVDANFFTMIRLPFVAGDPAKALARPDGVVLTEAAAIRYFGTGQAMGRTLIFDGGTVRVVTGILRDLAYNTQFVGEVFVRYPPPAPVDSHGVAGDGVSNLWTTMDVSAYVRLSPGADARAVEAQIPLVFMRHLSPAFISEVVSVVHGSAKDLISAKLVPFWDVHLTRYAQGSGMKPPGSRTLVYGFAAIAFLLLTIAGFNFTNLATARATLRAREVSLRKVVGASRRQLIVQFLAEAVLTALFALVVAFALAEMLLPAYGRFLGHPIAFDYLSDWPFALAMIAVAVATGLIGGAYPALVLSGFRPAEALHSAAAAPRGSGLMRTALVVFQFSVSIGLGIAAIVIFAQISFANRLDLGFDRENVVVLRTEGAGLSPASQDGMNEAIAALPGVVAAAMSDKVPASGNSPMNIVRIPGTGRQVSVMNYSVSPDFAAVYGVKLVAGRFLARNRGADIHHGRGPEGGRNILIDETAARAFGFTPQSAIGKTVDMIGGRMTVVGVVHNVLFAGAEAVQTAPTVYYDNPQLARNISVRLKAGTIPETLTGIDRVWKRFIPDKPPVRWFVDDSMNRIYADAENQGALMIVFVGLAVFIAALGLFGLAAFTVERRTKEIGIRKVFGATTPAVVRLLLWHFTKPVLIANLIAWPAAWYYLRHWLDSYAYRIELSVWYFVAAGAAALFIAWATVVSHAVSVARRPPVTALKYE
jgi:putative ABC transport system permease protein